MIDIYQKLCFLLTYREKRNVIILLLINILMGLLEVIGIASVMPFIAVVANPDIIRANKYLNLIYINFNFSNDKGFLIFLGVVSFLIVVSSLFIKAITQWGIARYSYMRNYTLSYRLLKGYLAQPYTWFLNRHSSDLGKTVLAEVGQVINGTLMPSMNLISHSIVTILLISLVILVDPIVAISTLIILGGAYLSIYLIFRSYLSTIGKSRVTANKERFKIAQDALSGIKDIKVLGKEDGYLKNFKKPSQDFARMQASNRIISIIPQYILQGIAFGGIIAIIVILLTVNNGRLEVVLPMIGLYAFAGMRLLPALQNVYSSISKLRFGKAALNLLFKDMTEIENQKTIVSDLNSSKKLSKLKLKQKIELSGVSYRYPKANNYALLDLNMKIDMGTRVAFVGPTGAGKTTAIDLILGLLDPTKGKFLVDDILIKGELVRSWQKTIGYVPQHIFLTDDTIAANIAFGIRSSKINMEQVEKASKIANLHEFVVSSLPHGYKSEIGERGVKLSGGQRQRIGIARALYNDPDVLVLDEATSSLDNITEKAVMKAVHDIGDQKLIIIVAHRLSTVQHCDMIYYFEKGNIKSAGKYNDLIMKDHKFRELANASF